MSLGLGIIQKVYDFKHIAFLKKDKEMENRRKFIQTSTLAGIASIVPMELIPNNKNQKFTEEEKNIVIDCFLSRDFEEQFKIIKSLDKIGKMFLTLFLSVREYEHGLSNEDAYFVTLLGVGNIDFNVDLLKKYPPTDKYIQFKKDLCDNLKLKGY